jgi:hypothetical protein
MQRLDHALIRLVGQETALANAAEASAYLQARRREREEVDAYLGARHSPSSASTLRSKPKAR